MLPRQPLVLTAATQTSISVTRSSATEAKAVNPVVHVVKFGIDMNALFAGLYVPWMRDNALSAGATGIGELSNSLESQGSGIETSFDRLHDPVLFPERRDATLVSVTEQTKIGLAKLFSGAANSLLNNQFLGVPVGDGSGQAGIVAQLDSKKVAALLISSTWKYQIFSTIQLRELLAGATAQGINTSAENPQPFIFVAGDQFNCNVLVTDADQGPDIVSWPNAQNVNKDLWMFQMLHVDPA